MSEITEKEMDKAEIRRAMGAESYFGFVISYFPHLFKFEIPRFHWKWYDLLEFFDKDQSFT